MQQNANRSYFEKKNQQFDDKFNTIFKLTSAASKIIGPDLTILKVNKALTDMMGYRAEEIEGSKILDYACEEYKDHWYELQTQLWSKKIPFFKLEACLRRKNGSLAWVNVTTILFEDGNERFGFTVLDDITGIKQYEESERRLNTVLRYTKVSIWEMDIKTKSIIRSEGHDQLLGYAAMQETWTLNSYTPYLWEEDLPVFKSALKSVIEGGIMDIQVRVTTKAESVRWLQFQAVRELDGHGKPILLGTVRDITKDKLIEQHKEEFISIASHELKTPVTSLKSSLQLLDRMKTGMEPNLQNMVTQANKSVNRITLLIDDLLNASKDPKGQLELKKTSFNLFTVIKQCVQLVFTDRHQVQINGPDNLKVHADVERIERVLVNLFSNAAKYVPASEQVSITIQQQEDMVKIMVADHGPGIAPQKLPLLFDRYYQSDGHGAQYSGLGLGLFISAAIVRKHCGEIGVESRLGKGSTFWFTIPTINF